MNKHTKLVCHAPTHTCLGDSPRAGSTEKAGDKEDSTRHGQEEA